MKLILLFISIIILFFVLKFFIRETFDNSCYVKDDCIERGDTSISQVNPELPECVGICINQHTFTNENCGKNCDSIGKLKFNQSDYIDLGEKLKLLSNEDLLKKVGIENKNYINDYLQEDRLMKIVENI